MNDGRMSEKELVELDEAQVYHEEEKEETNRCL